MKSFRRSRVLSVRHAISGCWYVIRTQQNAWLHLFATGCVVLLAAWLHLALRDWAVLFMAIAIVCTAEFLNTALETVVDLVNPKRHPLAKISKDVGAAAVLIAALSAAILGFIILGPPLWQRLTVLFETVRK